MTLATNGFPVISTEACAPDLSNPPRGTWTPITPGASVCQDWLVYHTNKGGPNEWNVYRLGNIPGKGSTPENLTQGPANTFSIAPALSPDRAQMAFATNRDGNWEVYVVPTDGQGKPQRVTYNTFAADLDPVWSPDGRFLVYTSVRRGNFDLFMIDVTKGPSSEIQLTNSPANELNPFWSTDGKRLVYESVSQGTSQVFSVDVTTLTTTRLSDGTGADFNPTFSPDGKHLTFRSYRGSNSNVGGLYVANADGSSAKLISSTTNTAFNSSWSPDSSLIAYQSNVNNVPSVYVYDPATSKTRQVTDKLMAGNKDALNYAPSWYCNSTTLVFTSDVSGKPNLYSTNALPIDAAPIKVETAASKLTNGTGTEQNQYSESSPPEEDASTIGFVSPTTGKR